MSNFYSEEFCRGNCPLTMSTYDWYCTNSEASVSSLFQGNLLFRTNNNITRHCYDW